MKYLLISVFLLTCFTLFAQEQQEETLDWDIETIFDQPLTETPVEQPQPVQPAQPPAQNVISQIRRNSITFTFGYRFNIGIAPGWWDYPWDDEFNYRDYYLERYIRMRSTMTVDAQISDVFRVVSSVYYNIPATTGTTFRLDLGNFYFDYNIYDRVLLRGGKFNLRWGISPNYRFTNLLARIPSSSYNRNSYIFRADIPIGVGGLQFLTLTRANLLNTNINPRIDDFGFGAKYNLAIPQIDLDFGLFYQNEMPLRSFLSLKKTLWNIEFYNEYLLAVNTSDNSVSGALNFGFGREFFDKKLTINGEFLYNAEKGTEWYQEETTFQDATTLVFVDGFNIALNLLYRPFEKGNPRIFFRLLYNPTYDSAQIMPGIRYSPLRHTELYLAVPIALGNKEGYYYNNTFIKIPGVNVNNPNAANHRPVVPLPFAVVFMVTINGQARFRQNL